MKSLKEILIAASLISLAGCKSPAMIDKKDMDKQKMIEVLLEVAKPKRIIRGGYIIGPCFDYQEIPAKNYLNDKDIYFKHEEPKNSK